MKKIDLLLNYWKIYQKLWTVDNLMQFEMVLCSKHIKFIFIVKLYTVNIISKWFVFSTFEAFSTRKKRRYIILC